MAITHSLVATDWTIDRQTGNIRYGGHDHNGADPSYATVIEFHRWLQQLADDGAPAAVDDELDISATNPSQRSTDNIITLINGYNIDDGAAEHLYDGSIIQDGGDTIYDGIINFGNANVQIQIIQDGAVIADDYWNYNIGDAASGGSGTTLVDTGIGWSTNQWAGYTVLNTTEGCQGIAESNTNDTITFASGQLHKGTNQDFEAADGYLIGQPLNPNATQGVSHRFMIKTRADGVDIDGRRLIGICRRYGNTYAEFKINGTSRGNNVLALSDTADLNNTTAPATAIGTQWDTDFSNTAGLRDIDVDQDGSTEEYYSEWTWINTHTINDLYERTKGLTEDVATETAELGHGLAGNVFRGITHSFLYDTETGGITISTNDMLLWGTNVVFNNGSGTFTVGEAIHEDTATPVWKGRVLGYTGAGATGSLIIDVGSDTVTTGDTFTGQSSGATADVNGTPTAVVGGGVLHILANDDTDDLLYTQVIKGTMAADEDILYYGGTDLTAIDVSDYVAVEDAVTAITERAISTPHIGVSTGSAIIGSYGLGVAQAKLSSSDLVFDLTDTPITPPNNVTNTVVLGSDYTDDRVLVAAWDGLTLDLNGDPTVGISGMTLATALDADDETAVVVSEDLTDTEIAAFLPSAGYLQVVDDGGVIRRLEYSGYVGATSTFTITTTTGDEDFLGDEAAVGNSVTVGQMHLVTALTGVTETSAVVNNIPGSTPNSGTLRIVNDEGFHIRTPYSVYDDGTDTFTITSSDWSGSGLTDSAQVGNHAYVTYLDLDAVASSASFQAVYDNDLNMVVVVRDGANTPIKQFISSWAFGDSASSISVIKTTDA
jgi:hypothetical protein